MSQNRIRYLGFVVATTCREYRFSVTGKDSPDSERIFTMAVAAMHFRPGLLKFQEGPEVSLHRLRSLLDSEIAGAPPTLLQQLLSDSDVADYASASPARSKVWTDAQGAAARRRRPNVLD